MYSRASRLHARERCRRQVREVAFQITFTMHVEAATYQLITFDVSLSAPCGANQARRSLLECVLPVSRTNTAVMPNDGGVGASSSGATTMLSHQEERHRVGCVVVGAVRRRMLTSARPRVLKALVFQLLESTPLSRHWIQHIDLHP